MATFVWDMAPRRYNLLMTWKLAQLLQQKEQKVYYVYYKDADFMLELLNQRLNCSVVYYGIHEGRFILWDADWGGPRQYWPHEMEILWIKGIALRLYPGCELMQKAEYHIKWWQLYDWTKWLKRRWDSLKEWIMVEIVPRFR